MRISNKEILFDQPRTFQSFVGDLELIGQIRFSQPICDNSGSIMIREKIFVKQSLIERLTEMSGQYKLPIAVEATDDLMAKIQLHLTNNIQKQIDQPGNALLRRLYSSLNRNHRPFILHSFRNRTLALLSYRLLNEKPDLFTHLSILGLTCLGIVLQQNVALPLIHRHAFLAGFTCMIGLADTDTWHFTPEEDAERKRRLERGAALIDQLGFAPGLGNVVRDSYFPTAEPKVVEDQFTGVLGGLVDAPANDQAQPAAGASDASDNAEASGEDENTTTRTVDPEAAPIITESLRLARFAYEMIVNSKDRVGAVQGLIQQMAYNSAKGYFSKRLVHGVADRFTEFESDVRYLEAIADVERKCLHGNNAWAYPKPRASQVLCSKNMLACPYLQNGWDFHLVSPQNAYGRIGQHLPAATYHKCSLEDDLPAIPVEMSASKKKKKNATDVESELPAVPGTENAN